MKKLRVLILPVITMSLMAGCAGAKPDKLESPETASTTEAVAETRTKFSRVEIEDFNIIEMIDMEINLDQPSLEDLLLELDTKLEFVSSSTPDGIEEGSFVVNLYRPNTMDDPYSYPPSVAVLSQSGSDFNYAVRLYYRDEGRERMELKAPTWMIPTRVLGEAIPGLIPEALEYNRELLIGEGWAFNDGVFEGTFDEDWTVDICGGDSVSYVTWYHCAEGDVELFRSRLGEINE